MKLGGFTVFNPQHPVKGHLIEDAFVAESEGKNRIILFAVADAVTRDPLPLLPDKSTPEGARLWRARYPDPSPAAEAARLACTAFLKNARKTLSLDSALVNANSAIGAYNRKRFPHPDFLVNDEAACQFACALFMNGSLHYASLSSCGVAVLDAKQKILRKTPDTYWATDAQRHAFLKKAGLELFASGHGVWEKPETRYILRSTYRNKQIPGGYGVLTGSPDALTFLSSGRILLKEHETVMLYTDGMAELLFQKPLKEKTSLRKDVKPFFKSQDFQGLETYCKQRVKSEGTLVYYTQ